MTKLFLLLTFAFAMASFGQDGPRGFYGCNGYDPNGWASEAGPGECVVASGRVDIPHGIYVDVHNPACGGGTSSFVSGLGLAMKADVSADLKPYLGPLAPMVGEKLGAEFTKGI